MECKLAKVVTSFFTVTLSLTVQRKMRINKSNELFSIIQARLGNYLLSLFFCVSSILPTVVKHFEKKEPTAARTHTPAPPPSTAKSLRRTRTPENRGTGTTQTNRGLKIIPPCTYRVVFYKSLQLLISIN